MYKPRAEIELYTYGELDARRTEGSIAFRVFLYIHKLVMSSHFLEVVYNSYRIKLVVTEARSTRII